MKTFEVLTDRECWSTFHKTRLLEIRMRVMDPVIYIDIEGLGDRLLEVFAVALPTGKVYHTKENLNAVLEHLRECMNEA